MNINTRLLMAQIVGMFLLFGAALFGAAGTIAWVAGWVFLILFFGFVVAVTVWLARHNPELLKERMTGASNPGRKEWDRRIQVINGILFSAWLVLMPLDAVRFGWSHVPVWLQAVGAILLLCSFHLCFLTFRENSYLSPAARIQKDREQTVVSTGLYRYVRHPMYAGFILLLFGTTLLIGSWYGFIPGLALILMVARRAILEERMLLDELPGYEAYMSRTRYRLVPRVW